MVQKYEAARLFYLRAGWMKNMGLRNTRETSLTKWFATDASFEAANEAIQIHGAYGFSDEYDVERYMRNSRGGVIYEGTSESSPMNVPVTLVHTETVASGRGYALDCIYATSVAEQIRPLVDFIVANFATRSDAECCIGATAEPEAPPAQ